MKKVLIIKIFLFFTGILYAKSQCFNLSHIQFGASAKLQVILNDNGGEGECFPTIRFGVNIGTSVVVNFLNEKFKFLPAYNFEALAYWNGLGSNPKNGSRLNVDLNNSVTLSPAIWNPKLEIYYKDNEINNSPLYYFSNHVKPALINPFHSSFTVGYNFITSTSKSKFSQRVGFFGLKIDRFQAAYFNDGGPVLNWFGDKKDRNYTAGLVISYSGKSDTNFLNRVELVYHKYTGYDRNNFEISSKLYLAHVDYIDSTQKYFNRSKWSIQATALKNTLSINVDGNNFIRFDLQHLIHWIIKDPYHMVPLRGGIAVGASTFLVTKPYFVK